MTLAGDIRNGAAIAACAAAAYIFPFKTNHLHRLSAAAFAGIAFAPLTGALFATAAENADSLLDG